MKALEQDVLQTGLEIQDFLLGPTIDFDPRRPSDSSTLSYASMTSLTPDMRDNLHAVNGLSNTSWFFHSPLQYWSCSAESIAEDPDILRTVNVNSHRSTSLNVTLRHSIVFSGKRFEDHRLVAADALVITLVHMLDSPVGVQWEKKSDELSKLGFGRWRLYPEDGRSLASTLYEFRFQPLSWKDDLFLALVYTGITIYFIYNLARFRALKSKIGLVSAVVAQIGVSIMSSFTICAIFKIDLSKLPRALYPIVVLAVGVENAFRAINAVIMTPSANPTPARIGEALGQTGHIALAGYAQNIAIIWAVSQFASPSVQALCTFAAIALTFDFFYLLTFFIAVLSIDVRRLELSDSLTRMSIRTSGYSSNKSHSRKTWWDSLLRGDAPVSTRVAGTVVMVSFIIIAQWHFFDESFSQTAFRFFRHMKSEPALEGSASLLSVDVHQARTPTAWLRMQDHETAHEVINIIKPNAHSYIARVYDPLVFVLEGSDRTPTNFGVRPFLPAVYDFARHQSTPFLFVILFTVTGVSLLMNYLLWDDSPETETEERPEDDPILSAKTMNTGHVLDVVLLTASGEGVIASVGLDRRIRIWDVRRGGMSYIVGDPDSDIDPFPVLAMTIDSDSNWLALLSKDTVYLWNIPERRWGPQKGVEIKFKAPAAFFFGYSHTELINPIVLVRHSGLMTELHMESGEQIELQICKTPLVSVLPHAEPALTPHADPPPLRIITASRRGCVHVATQQETGGWISEEVPCETGDIDDVTSILPLPILSSFLAVRTHSVELIDILTHKVTHTFPTSPIAPSTLQCFHSTRRRPQCGSVGLSYLVLAYTHAETAAAVMQVYLPEREGNTICFRDPYTPGSKTCCLWTETVEHTYTEPNPGTWEALFVGYIVGVRKCPSPSSITSPNSHNPSSQSQAISTHHAPSTPTTGLRRRGGFALRSAITESWKPHFNHGHSHGGNHNNHNPADDEDTWEVWSLSMRGERSTIPLNPLPPPPPSNPSSPTSPSSHPFNSPSNTYTQDHPYNNLTQDHLLIDTLGPLSKLGKRSIVVGLGNVIKVVTVGNERFDEDDGNLGGGAGESGLGGSLGLGSVGGRRRRGGRRV